MSESYVPLPDGRAIPVSMGLQRMILGPAATLATDARRTVAVCAPPSQGAKDLARAFHGPVGSAAKIGHALMIGSVVFGPRATDAERQADVLRRLKGQRDDADAVVVSSCNCIGAQPGQTKCPCALRAESAQGQAMIRDGITIDGVEYVLVRKA